MRSRIVPAATILADPELRRALAAGARQWGGEHRPAPTDLLLDTTTGLIHRVVLGRTDLASPWVSVPWPREGGEGEPTGWEHDPPGAFGSIEGRLFERRIESLADGPSLVLVLCSEARAFHRVVLAPLWVPLLERVPTEVGTWIRIEGARTRDRGGHLWIPRSLEAAEPGEPARLRDGAGHPLWAARAVHGCDPGALWPLAPLGALVEASVTCGGAPVGRIVEWIVDGSEGRVAYARVRLHGPVGTGPAPVVVAVPFAALRITEPLGIELAGERERLETAAALGLGGASERLQDHLFLEAVEAHWAAPAAARPAPSEGSVDSPTAGTWR